MSQFDYEASCIEVRFPANADNFLKVKETLTRIGAPAFNPESDRRTLWQSCHILYKRQRYYVVHYKELFLLDGRVEQTNYTDADKARRNAIARLLEQWGLVEIVNPELTMTPLPAPIETIKIIPFRDRALWDLRTKYDLGKIRRRI